MCFVKNIKHHQHKGGTRWSDAEWRAENVCRYKNWRKQHLQQLIRCFITEEPEERIPAKLTGIESLSSPASPFLSILIQKQHKSLPLVTRRITYPENKRMPAALPPSTVRHRQPHFMVADAHMSHVTCPYHSEGVPILTFHSTEYLKTVFSDLLVLNRCKRYLWPVVIDVIFIGGFENVFDLQPVTAQPALWICLLTCCCLIWCLSLCPLYVRYLKYCAFTIISIGSFHFLLLYVFPFY